jgi:hypothetical protein
MAQKPKQQVKLKPTPEPIPGQAKPKDSREQEKASERDPRHDGNTTEPDSEGE